MLAHGGGVNGRARGDMARGPAVSRPLSEKFHEQFSGGRKGGGAFPRACGRQATLVALYRPARRDGCRERTGEQERGCGAGGWRRGRAGEYAGRGVGEWPSSEKFHEPCSGDREGRARRGRSEVLCGHSLRVGEQRIRGAAGAAGREGEAIGWAGEWGTGHWVKYFTSEAQASEMGGRGGRRRGDRPATEWGNGD